MTPDDQQRFGPAVSTLRDGRQLIIRPLRTDDGPALAAFYAQIPPHDFRFYCPYDLTRARALKVAARADSELEVVLVAQLPDHTIGGYAWYRWDHLDADASVFGICIAPSCQNAGVGRRLMQRLLQIAGQGAIGPRTMTLTVQLANPRAVGLYQSLGFQIVAQQMREPKPQWNLEPEPEYRMQLQLD